MASPPLGAILEFEVFFVEGLCPSFNGAGTGTLAWNPASGSYQGQIGGLSVTATAGGVFSDVPCGVNCVGYAIAFSGPNCDMEIWLFIWGAATPVRAVPICSCACDCGPAGKGGGGGTLGHGGRRGLPQGEPPSSEGNTRELSSGPIRFSTGEVIVTATDLLTGGFGAPWGHTRSFNSRMYTDADVGMGPNWQVAEWPLSYLRKSLPRKMDK